MISNDNLFFEEYKRLDRLCSDIYSCQNGVSQYIADMEGNDAYGKFRVPSWDDDFRMLKHIRWVRNRIAHALETGPLSEESDLYFVQDFYERILSGQDPLTLLRKANELRRTTEKQSEKHSEEYIPPQKPQKREGRSPSYVKGDKKQHGFLFPFIGVLFLALLAFFLLYWQGV